MADAMMPPGIGMPKSGGGALENFKKNRSLAAPVDAAMMVQDGTIKPEMTIAEFFQNTMGLDVNKNTVMDMVAASKDNVAKGLNPMKKMEALAGGPGMGQPPAQAPMAPPQGEPKGLDDLINTMR